MPINLDIDEVYVYPQPAGENPDYVGIEEELGVKVIAKEGVDTKSYGISGAVAFPDATAKLFTIPDGMESKFAVNDFGSSGRPNMIDFAAYKNGTSTITDGSDRWIRFIEAFSNDGPQDSPWAAPWGISWPGGCWANTPSPSPARCWCCWASGRRWARPCLKIVNTPNRRAVCPLDGPIFP